MDDGGAGDRGALRFSEQPIETRMIFGHEHFDRAGHASAPLFKARTAPRWPERRGFPAAIDRPPPASSAK